MEKLNEYLQQLLSSCSDELRLEPDKNPCLVQENRTLDASKMPLMGAQISAMVFPLIPPNVRASLPNRNEVDFVHPHNLGEFSFNVKKSPAGFIVTVRPVISQVSGDIGMAPPVVNFANGSNETAEPTPQFEPTSLAAQPQEMIDTPPAAASPASLDIPDPSPIPSFEQISYELESSSRAYETNAFGEVATPTIPELMLDEPVTPAPEYVPSLSLDDDFQVVPVNDPSFQTVFSDTAPDTPVDRWRDFTASEYVPDQETPPPPPQDPPMQNVTFQGSETAEQAVYSSAPQHPPVVDTAPQYTPPAQYAPAKGPAVSASFIPGQPSPVAKGRMDSLFQKMAEIGASDLHLSVSMPPMVRRDGKMQRLEQGDIPLTPESMRDLLTSIMPPRNQQEFAERSDTDFAYEIPGMARFRSNIFADRKGMGAVFRIIPSQILTAEKLGLSKAIMDLCTLSKGLVVVTGPTGSGKSTTLCAMVDHINKNREDHIITIEDPIEFVHENQKCLVNQREVHNHTDSFKNALRAALREDPDIVLVGEMRDLETISIAIETAETGHLVFGTLHTTTAASTVDRIIDQFPADRQQQIRVMLSESLKGVIAQTLLPKRGGGRVAALEVLIVTPAISNLIREGKTFQIPSAMQTGRNHGMVMLNDALFEHVKNGLVEPMDAYIKAVDKTGFETMLTRGGFKL